MQIKSNNLQKPKDATIQGKALQQLTWSWTGKTSVTTKFLQKELHQWSLKKYANFFINTGYSPPLSHIISQKIFFSKFPPFTKPRVAKNHLLFPESK